MRNATRAILFFLASATSLAHAQSPPPGPAKALKARNSTPDAIDDLIREEMQKRRVPGLSLAIIQAGEIIKAKGYGLTEKGGRDPVTPSTLFQAGSISKPVSALGALRLVEVGKLALDEDVNARLTSWKVPENEFTRERKVTLRGILSHAAGLTVHGFPGYATDGPIPTLVQVLDGVKPSNTAPIRVDIPPGSEERYSGGGYTVAQQMMIDVTGEPFPRYMREAVLGPLEMTASTFEQPPPSERSRITATAHLLDRSPVKGRWHIYPEMAAAGLWTTPSDLARFAVGVQEAVSGKSGKTLSRQMARQMLTEQRKGTGLGVALRGGGFDALLVACAETGQGAVIMINANDNSGMVNRIMDAIARAYRWPDYPSFTPPDRPRVRVPEGKLAAYAGRYEFANNRMLAFAAGRGGLFTLVDGFPDEEFLPEADDRFYSSQRDARVAFLEDGDGKVVGYLWKEGGHEREVPRIGPLFHSLKPETDPDPARTGRIVTALRALGEGGKALADSLMFTPGARADLGVGGLARDLASIQSVVFLAEQDVAGRRIERHKGQVSRIIHYRLVSDKIDRGLLVHVTSDGLVTDYDIVED
jgi:CubicO group peptidase (beta-lactamase class C family)